MSREHSVKSEPDTFWPNGEPPQVWRLVISLPVIFIALLLDRIKLRRLGVRMMELALKCEPRQPGNRLALAKLQFIIGRKKDAVRSFLEVTRLRPDDTEAYTVLEKMVLSYDVHEKDLEGVRQMVREEGDSFWAHMFMGLMLQGQGETASFSLITGEGTIEVEEATSLENALESFQEAVRLRPESSLAYLKLADCLKGLERFERALDSYEKAHQLEPGLGEARLSMGTCLERLGRAKEAIALLEEETREYPGEGLPFVCLGRVYERSGRRKEALECYKEAVRLEPDDFVFPFLVKAALESEPKGNQRRKRKKKK